MDARQFPAQVRQMARRIDKYAKDEFPAMAARKTLRFIDGNFRAQGYQGKTFEPWQDNQRGGTILVHKGFLRRSFRQEVRPGYVRTWSTSKHAAVHNRGFKGKVNIPAHTRRKFKSRRAGTGRYTKTGRERKKTVHEQSGATTVKQHVRNMNIPKRQFMPETANDSPVLANSIKRDIDKRLKHFTK